MRSKFGKLGGESYFSKVHSSEGILYLRMKRRLYPLLELMTWFSLLFRLRPCVILSMTILTKPALFIQDSDLIDTK